MNVRVDEDSPTLESYAGDPLAPTAIAAAVFGALSMRDVIAAGETGVAPHADVHWVDGGFLAVQGCEGWTDLPLWIRPGPTYHGIFNADVTRAVGAGLRRRPLDETVPATRDWYAGRTSLAAGLDSQREMELLGKWNAAISS